MARASQLFLRGARGTRARSFLLCSLAADRNPTRMEAFIFLSSLTVFLVVIAAAR
jgi:hypothetical protein